MSDRITTQGEAIELMPPEGRTLMYQMRGMMSLRLGNRTVDSRVVDRLLEKGVWEVVESTRDHVGVLIRPAGLERSCKTCDDTRERPTLSRSEHKRLKVLDALACPDCGGNDA
jgi:hypothetical protein